jgi:hypothetical protein
MEMDDEYEEVDCREAVETEITDREIVSNLSGVSGVSAAEIQQYFEGSEIFRELRNLPRVVDAWRESMNHSIGDIKANLDNLVKRVKNLEALTKTNIPEKTIQDIKIFLAERSNEQNTAADGSINPHSFEGILNRTGGLKVFNEIR